MAKTHNSLLLTEARAGGTAALTLDAAATIGDGEPVELLYKQPAEYLDGRVWVMTRATEGLIRGMQGDAFLYNPNPAGSDRGRPEILGYPVYNSAYASAVAASAKSSSSATSATSVCVKRRGLRSCATRTGWLIWGRCACCTTSARFTRPCRRKRFSTRPTRRLSGVSVEAGGGVTAAARQR
jgi:hypothetical protein